MRAPLLIAGLIAMLASAGWAEEGQGGYGPAIPEATGEPHPEGNAFMRRWHMSMMRHDRDVTMYEGKREQNASLGGCFECHAAKDETGTPVTYADERHFCRSCHDFVAVRVDCFDCHRSTPEGVPEPAHAALGGVLTPSMARADLGALVAYLGTREAGQ